MPDVDGANDNASGIAAVLTLAEELADRSFPFTLRFIAFGSEETGLNGSKHYVSALTEDERGEIKAMINLDVVGTGEGIRITGDSWLTGHVSETADREGITVGLRGGMRGGSSDHASFREAGIPVIFFFADDVSRIHTPEDTLKYIDPSCWGTQPALCWTCWTPWIACRTTPVMSYSISLGILRQNSHPGHGRCHMKWASAISEHTALEDAIKECCAGVRRQLDGEAPDLAVIFVSAHHQAGYEQVVEFVQGAFPSVPVFGCSGGGIIGDGQEVEQRPAVSVTAASLPDVEIVQCYLENDGLPDLDAGPTSWEQIVNVSPSDDPQFVVLADPFPSRSRTSCWGWTSPLAPPQRSVASPAERSRAGQRAVPGRPDLPFGRGVPGPSRQYHR